MHAIVDARKSNQPGQRQHEEHAPPEIEEKHRRGSEPVGGVCRWHAEASAPADAGDGVRNFVERTESSDGVFQRVDDERVTETNHQREHNQADAAASALFPDQDRRERDEKGDENRVAAEKGHDPIEERIAQRLVDEAKQRDVE